MQIRAVWEFVKAHWVGSLSVLVIPFALWFLGLFAEKAVEKAVVEPAIGWFSTARLFGQSTKVAVPLEIKAGVQSGVFSALSSGPSSLSLQSSIDTEGETEKAPTFKAISQKKRVEEQFVDQLNLGIQIGSVPLPNQLSFSEAVTPFGTVRKYCTARMFAFVEVSNGGAVLSYVFISRAADFKPVGKRSGIRIGERTFEKQEWQNENPENQEFLETGGRYLDYYAQGPAWRGTGYASTILGYTSAGFNFSGSTKKYLSESGLDTQQFRVFEKPNVIGEGHGLREFIDSYLPDGHDLFDLGFQCR